MYPVDEEEAEDYVVTWAFRDAAGREARVLHGAAEGLGVEGGTRIEEGIAYHDA